MKRINKEEKDILKSYEKGEWLPTADLQEQKKRNQRYARNTFLKNKRINIRISE